MNGAHEGTTIKSLIDSGGSEDRQRIREKRGARVTPASWRTSIFEIVKCLVQKGLWRKTKSAKWNFIWRTRTNSTKDAFAPPGRRGDGETGRRGDGYCCARRPWRNFGNGTRDFVDGIRRKMPSVVHCKITALI